MTMRITRVTLIAICGIALSACSESGTPVPDGGKTTTPPSAGQPTTTPNQNDRHGAPDVQNPLDPSAMLKDPCKSLSAPQLSALGLNDKPRNTDASDPVGPHCTWETANDEGSRFRIGYITANENGLADLYRANEEGEWAYWEPTTVNGYPAVWQEDVDLRDSGSCAISVGITDELAFTVFSGNVDPRPAACDRSKEVAGAVVDTLKSGG